METVTVTAPLSVEQIKHFYENKGNVRHIIDYDSSSLKGKGLLFYISNLELDADIFFESTPTEEKLDLLKEYMSILNLTSVSSLNLTTMQLILQYKNIETSGVFSNISFTKEELTQFIEDNKDLVNRWYTFINSLFVFSLFVLKEADSLPENVSGQYKIIDDINYVGNNVVYLFKIPSFFELFFSEGANTEDMYFFKQQFTEYCYGGKNLFSFFAFEENFLLSAVCGLLQNEMASIKEESNES